jgi:hypothetical protein
MASIVNPRRSTMNRSHNTTRRALARFALVALASAAAASLWAQGRSSEGLLLDASTWQEEVVTASTGPWPADGWYRLVPQEKAIEVRAVSPKDAVTVTSADALYFRLPGTDLKQGRRPGYRYPAVLQQPRMGVDHELSLGGTRFSLRVGYVDQGIEYAIGYGGQTYSYVLGGPGADHTVMRAIADVDGDALPDFVVDVDDGVYLLLSTRAQPGANRPTAHFTEQPGC